MLRAAARVSRGGEAKGVEAAWLAYSALVLLAVWCAVQSPDVSWDGLAYHLPEARDLARTGAVRPLADLAPHSLLWRNYDAFLSLGFFAGGEAVVRFLQFAVGLGVFAAACALARRVGAGKSGTLVVLALAAFPTAVLQLHATYVDWPTALFTTACAAELMRARSEPGRIRSAGFLLGAAVAAKIFAVTALPALAILAARARPRLGAALAASALALTALLPWAAWSERRVGSWTEPFAPSVRAAASRVSAGHYFRTSPASGEARRAPDPTRAVTAFLRLPYDLVFHSSRFEANGDGYNGLVVLLLAVGILGWRAGGSASSPPPRSRCSPSVAALPSLDPVPVSDVSPLRRVRGGGTEAADARLRRRRGDRGGRGDPDRRRRCYRCSSARAVSSGAWRSDACRARRASRPGCRRIRSGPRSRGSDRVVMLGENDRFHRPAGVGVASRVPAGSALGRRSGGVAGLRELSITKLVWREDRVPAPSGSSSHSGTFCGSRRRQRRGDALLRSRPPAPAAEPSTSPGEPSEVH